MCFALAAVTPILMTPDCAWSWFGIEASPVEADGKYDTGKPKVDFLFLGLVMGFETELGYFSLHELENARGPMGLPVERDLYFKPTRLSELEKS